MKSIIVLLCFIYQFGLAQESKEKIISIYFDGGSYYIDAYQKTELKKFVNDIPNLQYYEINIMSHTDNIGSKEFNLYLSQLRSKSVIYELNSYDIPQERIKFKDFGFEAPRFDNTTVEGRSNNRRVDILFKPLVF